MFQFYHFQFIHPSGVKILTQCLSKNNLFVSQTDHTPPQSDDEHVVQLVIFKINEVLVCRAASKNTVRTKKLPKLKKQKVFISPHGFDFIPTVSVQKIVLSK